MSKYSFPAVKMALKSIMHYQNRIKFHFQFYSKLNMTWFIFQSIVTLLPTV